MKPSNYYILVHEGDNGKKIGAYIETHAQESDLVLIPEKQEIQSASVEHLKRQDLEIRGWVDPSACVESDLKYAYAKTSICLLLQPENKRRVFVLLPKEYITPGEDEGTIATMAAKILRQTLIRLNAKLVFT